MRKIYKPVIVILLAGLAFSNMVNAQDPHFSQYFSSPLTFNPAFTGYFDALSRFTCNIRNQWNNAGDPYTTGTASFDTRILKNKISSNNRWGLGVHALYDQSAGGVFKNSYLSLSTGFNKGLDANGDQSIGIGIQASLARNSVDFNKISFNSQFNGEGFDLSIPSGETVNNFSVSYFDLNAGILYNYKDENGNQYSFGASMFHILKPRVSFFSGNNPTVQQRFTLHAGVNINVGEKNSFFISAHGMKQGNANEYVIGAAYGLGIGSTNVSLYLGGWLRIKDAFYPYVGLQSADYQLGLSYDIISSDITQVNRFSGSSELSFIYFFNTSWKKKGIPCFF